MKFGLKDKERFKEMISQLKFYNDWLLQYCSSEDAKKMERAFQNLAEGQNLESLRQLGKAASLEAQATAAQSPEQRHHGRLQNINESKYTRLQNTVQFRLATVEAKNVPAFKYEQFTFAPHYLFKQGQATMAIWNAPGQPRVVMIEWRSCEKSQETEVAHLAATMYRNKPKEICVPLCYGMIFPSAQNPSRFGLVLELPEHIRRFTNADPSQGIVRFRMPTTLKQVLRRPSHPLELGQRFRLAKALAESVHSMHSCGWVSAMLLPRKVFDVVPPMYILDFSQLGSLLSLRYTKIFVQNLLSSFQPSLALALGHLCRTLSVLTSKIR